MDHGKTAQRKPPDPGGPHRALTLLRVLLPALLLASIPILAACSPVSPAPREASGAPVKIGYLTPLTGRMAPYGHAQKLVVSLAVEDINSGGGVNGHPIQVLREDSAFDPKQALSLGRKLAEQEKVLAILGPFASGEFEVVAPLAVELQVPIVAGTTTKPGMSAANRPWAFRMTLTDDVSTPAGLDFMKRKYPQVKKVLIVGDSKESVAENMVRNIYPRFLKEKGFEVLGTVDFETSTTDYSAIVTKVKGLNPDAIAYASLPANAIAFAKELKRQGVALPTLAGPQLQPAPPVEGMETWFMAGFFDEKAADTNVQKLMAHLKAAAEADANVPKPFSVSFEPYLYDAAMVLAEGLREARMSPESPLDQAWVAVRDAFQGLKGYRGIVGTYTMNADGDAITSPVLLKADVAKRAWARAN